MGVLYKKGGQLGVGLACTSLWGVKIYSVVVSTSTTVPARSLKAL